MKSDYWFDSVKSSLSEAGILATQKQIEQIAGDMEVSHDQYDMAFGYDVASQNLQASKNNEIVKLKKKLREEQEKQTCKECNGRGYVREQGPVHGSEFTCYKCKGAGRI
jgi:DnaJ-class molecular chaperone